MTRHTTAAFDFLGRNLHQLTVSHHGLFRSPKCAGEKAGAALGARELNVSVGAGATSVQRGVSENVLILVIRHALVFGVVPVPALGAKRFREQGVVRKVVQRRRNMRRFGTQQTRWARHFLFTTSTF